MNSILQKLFLIIICIGFFSCSKDEPSCDENDIIGSWLLTNICELVDDEATNCSEVIYEPCINEPIDGHYFIFNSDGSYRSNFATCDGQNNYRCSDAELGIWEINDNQISIFINQEFDCHREEFTNISDQGIITIVSCTSEEFVANADLDSTESNQVTFTRQ